MTASSGCSCDSGTVRLETVQDDSESGVDDQPDREQRHDGGPGPPLAPPQSMRQHQQQQPDDYVGGAGQVYQRAGHEIRQAAQTPVIQAGQQALDDVAESNDQRRNAGSQRHPAQLLAQIGAAKDGRLRPPFAFAG